LAALVGALLLGMLVLLHSLDRPWLRERVKALVHASAGVDIDYGAVRLGLLSGVDIDDVVVRSPAELRALAPEFVRIGHIGARWSAGSLRGRGPAIERLTISDLSLTVVVDEHGQTSFDALSPPAAKPSPGVPVPLSHRLAVLQAAPPVGVVEVDRVTLALVQTTDGHVSQRSELRGLAAAVTAQPAGPGITGWRVQMTLGTKALPLDLALTRDASGAPSQEGRARLGLEVDATSSQLDAVLDLRVLEQTFAAGVPADHGLHAEAHARFDAAAGKTDVSVEHTEAGEGAATLEASVELPDAGDPVVRHAKGDVDLARLLSWVPADVLPVRVTAGRARLGYRVESFVIGPVLQLSNVGQVALDADLADIGVGPHRLGAGTISLNLQPAAAGAVSGRGTIHLAAAHVESAADTIDAGELSMDVDAQQDGDGVVAGHVALRFAQLDAKTPAAVVAREGRIDLGLAGLRLDTGEPLASRGDVTLAIDLPSLEASAGVRVLLEGLKLRAHTRLEGHAPYAGELEAPMARLRVARGEGRVLTDGPARLEVRAHDVLPDASRPVASRAGVHLGLALGDVEVALDATKEADAVDFALHAAARSLARVRPFLSASLSAAAPWDRMALAVRSNGRVEHLGSVPSLRQTTEIQVDRPSFASLTAHSLGATLRSQGTALAQNLDLDLRTQALAIEGGSPADDHLTLSATVDRTAPSLRFQLASDGRAATRLSGSASFDPARRALLYQADGHLAGLAPLAPLAAKVAGLAAFDLSQLDVGVSSRGSLLGVVDGVGPDGTITLAPDPARSAAVEGIADVQVAHLHWAQGDSAITAPALSWHADLHASGARRTLESRLDVGTVHLDLGSRDVDLNGIHHEATVSLDGEPAAAVVESAQRLTVRAVEQDLVPEYPLGDLEVSLAADRGPEGVVHISDLKIANGRGGTALAMSGNLDLGEGRRTLSVTASLDQELERLSAIPDRFKGRGKVSVAATVTSPDLAHVRVRSVVKSDSVSLGMPSLGIKVDTANGEVPITVAFEVSARGVALERSESRSPYSMLRFADQHPLLSRSGFLSIARLDTPFVSIAPLVGNLEIDQNVVSLRQFEMGVRGGSITGQCGIDWDGPRSTLELHVRASGVQSSHGEPFDGNIAIAFSAADRTVEGRAEILRIGERHLLDLLDLQDPLHVDPGMNRIRTALLFGYPDTLRLVFDHGFASAHLELGGLARLVSIGDLRGIPMGPIVDRALGPLLDGLQKKERP
jgi:hypothetical protein